MRVHELIEGVDIVLGRRPMADCWPLDTDGNGTALIDEIVAAVHHALNGCAGEFNNSQSTNNGGTR